MSASASFPRGGGTAACPCSVRLARAEDAAVAAEVMRQSIRELCAADHQGDAAAVERWTQNKDAQTFLQWMADPSATVLVAERSRVCGVGLITDRGQIKLCYVQPGAQRSGVGSALLSALEARAAALGLDTLRLRSTLSARAFYERHGFVGCGAPVHRFGPCYAFPYEKRLRAPID